MDLSFDVSTGLVVQPFSFIFIFFQMAFSLALFSGLHFWYLPYPLWAVASDTWELRTANHDAKLPGLFIREQIRWGDFNPQWDMIFLPQMSYLFIFLFYASRHAINDL